MRTLFTILPFLDPRSVTRLELSCRREIGAASASIIYKGNRLQANVRISIPSYSVQSCAVLRLNIYDSGDNEATSTVYLKGISER